MKYAVRAFLKFIIICVINLQVQNANRCMSMTPADYSALTSVCLPFSIIHLYRLANCLILLLTVVQEGWCDSVGSVEEIQAKLLKRQEAAVKRERAMAYALAHQVRL